MREMETTVGEILPQSLRLQDAMICERRIPNTRTEICQSLRIRVGKYQHDVLKLSYIIDRLTVSDKEELHGKNDREIRADICSSSPAAITSNYEYAYSVADELVDIGPVASAKQVWDA